MQIPSRFTIAVHILTLIALNKDNETKLTSDFMAGIVQWIASVQVVNSLVFMIILIQRVQ